MVSTMYLTEQISIAELAGYSIVQDKCAEQNVHQYGGSWNVTS